MGLKIRECLLNDENDFVIGNGTLGEVIASSGKEYLWGPRMRSKINTIVLHYISATYYEPDDPYNLGRILELFVKYGVSAHYLIDRGGNILRLVPEMYKAWHCGPSLMPEPDNRQDVNQFSIGIELMGMRNVKFTAKQYDALAALCIDIEKRYFREMIYVGHDEIAGKRAVAEGLRREPKYDPGPMFDWGRLAGLVRGTGAPAPVA